MNDRINEEATVAPAPGKPASGLRGRTTRLAKALRKRGVFGIAAVVCAAATAYWGLVASDRYVSQANVIVQRTDLAGGHTMDFSSLLGGVNGSRSDELLLRNYLLSMDMLRKLDKELNLRAHYSDRARDPLSRMWAKDVPDEWFLQYYLSRVSVELDEYSGVLVIKAQGYDARTAQAITTLLVREGERAMNEMAHQLARDQVAFVEKQVAQMAERFQRTRQAVVRFQNTHGLVSPQSRAEQLNGVVERLNAQRTELQTRRTALLGYLEPRAAGVVEIDLQIEAIDKQLAQEQARLTSTSGKALNSTVEEYQRLEMEAGFANDVYKTALVALEKGRVEATRNLKKVSVVQSPTLPQHALEPRRGYNIIVSVLVTLLLAGVVHLLAAIVRDHKD
ncbi:chain-length determining protein [Massilia haematophila]|uniref:Chain-length determining protein n=1 Tax=Massilia haematophila TaxID=457923 RepID=A0ABV7PM61_9BURK|nr:chain-length determining protein [Massilia sp.]